MSERERSRILFRMAELVREQRIELLRNTGAKWARKTILDHGRRRPNVWTRFVAPHQLDLVQACIRMDEDEIETFNKLGGSPWLRAVLQESIDKRKGNGHA